MEELLRSRVGRYSLFESHTLAQVEAAVADGTVPGYDRSGGEGSG